MPKTRSIFLYPFSVLYGIITSVRNFLYNSGILHSHEFSIPVICVGNLAVGGTGKTPHTEYLIDILKKQFKVSVLSRGYRRKSSGFMIAGQNSSVNDIGDEPFQIYRKFPDVTVAVDKDRVHGVGELLKCRPETAVIILDDGFQHRKITPGLSILLSDFGRLMTRDHLLPYGNLRESRCNINRADIILITKSPGNISPIDRRLIVREINKAPYQNLYFTSVLYKDPLPVFETGININELTPDTNSGENGFVVVTGIANPEPLVAFMKTRSDEIIHLSFGDHHNYSAGDIEKIKTAWLSLKAPLKYVITTEKDAMRFRELNDISEPLRSAFFYIPIGIWFLNDDSAEFDKMIVDYVRKNKRNNRVS